MWVIQNEKQTRNNITSSEVECTQKLPHLVQIVYVKKRRLEMRPHYSSHDEKVGQRRKSGTKKGKVYLGHFLEFKWTKTIKKYIERYSSIWVRRT